MRVLVRSLLLLGGNCGHANFFTLLLQERLHAESEAKTGHGRREMSSDKDAFLPTLTLDEFFNDSTRISGFIEVQRHYCYLGVHYLLCFWIRAFVVALAVDLRPSSLFTSERTLLGFHNSSFLSCHLWPPHL